MRVGVHTAAAHALSLHNSSNSGGSLKQQRHAAQHTNTHNDTDTSSAPNVVCVCLSYAEVIMKHPHAIDSAVKVRLFVCVVPFANGTTC